MNNFTVKLPQSIDSPTLRGLISEILAWSYEMGVPILVGDTIAIEETQVVLVSKVFSKNIEMTKNETDGEIVVETVFKFNEKV